MKRSALLSMGLLFLGGLAQAREASSAIDPKKYLSELEKKGFVDRSLATPERLAQEIRAADEELNQGRPQAAAARLYAIVEGPRFADLAESDDYQDAEYRLGLALHRGGGYDGARHYLARVLQRGSKAPLYHPALRAYVDVCLDAKSAAACVDSLNGLGAEDLGEELSYLRGRAAFDADRRDAAEGELGRVTPRSRFYSSAIYLRGVLRIKQGDYQGAEQAFCAIADLKSGDRLRFYIDGRYYAIQDLARLGLGRVAHEEGRFDDAFYHYFLIPSDSKRLPEALFEAAWSSLERKDYDLGARLIDEFLKAFPHTPRTVEAQVLRATLFVKTCRFRQAEDAYDTILQEYERLGRTIDAALADPAQRRALTEQLTRGPSTSPRPLLGVLELDPHFELLQTLARGLDEEAVDASHVEELWHELDRTLSHTTVQRTSMPLDAATLFERTRALGAELTRAQAELRPKGRRPSPAEAEVLTSLASLEGRRVALSQALSKTLARVPESSESNHGSDTSGLSPLLRADATHAGQLRARALHLRARLEEAEGELVRRALVTLRSRIISTLRSARLGKIDAVIGSKRKIEHEIEDLAAGRFPPELTGKLHLEGLIGDDEEYWPPEGERWADEYENYK